MPGLDQSRPEMTIFAPIRHSPPKAEADRHQDRHSRLGPRARRSNRKVVEVWLDRSRVSSHVMRCPEPLLSVIEQPCSGKTCVCSMNTPSHCTKSIRHAPTSTRQRANSRPSSRYCRGERIYETVSRRFRKLRACPEITESTFERVKYGFTTRRSIPYVVV